MNYKKVMEITNKLIRFNLWYNLIKKSNNDWEKLYYLKPKLTLTTSLKF